MGTRWMWMGEGKKDEKSKIRRNHANGTTLSSYIHSDKELEGVPWRVLLLDTGEFYLI